MKNLTYQQRAALCTAAADNANLTPVERDAWKAAAAAWESFAHPRRAPSAHGQDMQARHQLARKLAELPAEQPTSQTGGTHVCTPWCPINHTVEPKEVKATYQPIEF